MWRVELVHALRTMLDIGRSYLSRHLVLFNKCSLKADVTLGCSSSSLVDVFGFVILARQGYAVQSGFRAAGWFFPHTVCHNGTWTSKLNLNIAWLTKPKTSTNDDGEQPKVTSAIGELLLNNTQCLDKCDRSMFSIVCRARTSSTLHVLDPLFIKKLKPELCKQMEFVKCLDLFPT